MTFFSVSEILTILATQRMKSCVCLSVTADQWRVSVPVGYAGIAQDTLPHIERRQCEQWIFPYDSLRRVCRSRIWLAGSACLLPTTRLHHQRLRKVFTCNSTLSLDAIPQCITYHMTCRQVPGMSSAHVKLTSDWRQLLPVPVCHHCTGLSSHMYRWLHIWKLWEWGQYIRTCIVIATFLLLLPVRYSFLSFLLVVDLYICDSFILYMMFTYIHMKEFKTFASLPSQLYPPLSLISS